MLAGKTNNYHKFNIIPQRASVLPSGISVTPRASSRLYSRVAVTLGGNCAKSASTTRKCKRRHFAVPFPGLWVLIL